MARPFTVYNGGLLGVGQASTPTSISAYDIEDELAARGYAMQAHEPVGPVPGVHEPIEHAAPVPGLHEPVGPVPGVHEPIEHAAPVPGLHEPVHEPGQHLPPLVVPGVYVPQDLASPYTKYIRFLPYLVVLFQDKSILDFQKIV